MAVGNEGGSPFTLAGGTSIAGRSTAELLEQIRAGDRSAFTALYDELAAFLWSIAILQTRAHDLAEDVVQDVFFRFWIRRAALPHDLDIRVYLAAAVRNRARDFARRRRASEAMQAVVMREDTVSLDTRQETVSAEKRAEAQDFHEAYKRALGALTLREREAALLRWEQGMTLEQIAHVLSLSIAGARKVLLRAQQKVQNGLQDHHT